VPATELLGETVAVGVGAGSGVLFPGCSELTKRHEVAEPKTEKARTARRLILELSRIGLSYGAPIGLTLFERLVNRKKRRPRWAAFGLTRIVSACIRRLYILFLLRQTDTAQQSLIARVGAQAVKEWVGADVLQLKIVRSVGSFEQRERVVFLIQPGV